MFPGSHGLDGDEGVGVVRRGDEHRVDVFFALQHDAEVLVSRAFEVRRLIRVMLLDHALGGEPASHFLVVGKRFFGVIGLSRVCHGNDLHIIELEEVLEVGMPLPATANEGDVHLLTGRHKAGTAEHMARHDVEGGDGGRCCSEKLATRERGVGWIHVMNEVLGLFQLTHKDIAELDE
jgi:hypothetical protein